MAGLLREFIPTMARRPKWIKDQKPLEVGNLVWILEYMTPWGIWPVGIVEKLSHSNDGKVRSCEIRTGFGKQTRPVNKLAVVIDDYETDYNVETGHKFNKQ